MKLLGVLASVVLLSCSVNFVVGSNVTSDQSEKIVLPKALYYPTPIDDLKQYPGELCRRKCVKGSPSRVCYWEFNVEHYQTMGVACGNCNQTAGAYADCYKEQCVPADGIERGFIAINRRLAGPDIQVCHRDVIVVDLINKADGKAITIHWHGQHQTKTPWMDGVPYCTQCPIPFGETFRYIFEAETIGTHFYHAHAGLLKVDGVFGALFVRQDKSLDPHGKLYNVDDYNHYILFNDWFDEPSDMWVPGLPTRPHGINADSVLINGFGQRIGANPTDRTNTPLARFCVQYNMTYRFRIINSGSDSCPFELQFQDHTLIAISSDGKDFQPKEFRNLVSNSGERFDVLFTANQVPGTYLIRVRQTGSCVDTFLETFGIIQYGCTDPKAAPYSNPSLPTYYENWPAEPYLNHPNSTCNGDPNRICVTELRALDQNTFLRDAQPLYRFFLGFDNVELDNSLVFKPGTYEKFENLEGDLTLIGAINNLSLTFPPFPLLTQPENLPSVQFCNDNNPSTNCPYGKVCFCIHVLKVPLNAVVELVIVDQRAFIIFLNHPFHLHGYDFMVTDMGQNPDGSGSPMTVSLAKELQSLNALQSATAYNPQPIFKDTISIPSHGFAKMRFIANNPGYWLLHCHYDWHMETGMGAIVQVGEPAQMKPAPQGFPKCNNFKPTVMEMGGYYYIP